MSSVTYDNEGQFDKNKSRSKTYVYIVLDI